MKDAGKEQKQKHGTDGKARKGYILGLDQEKGGSLTRKARQDTLGK
jgi:hypothetical protein